MCSSLVASISNAGASKKSAIRAMRIVNPVRNPKLTMHFKVAVIRTKQPEERIREVTNRARPVPSSDSLMAWWASLVWS